jgi:nitroreductase
LTVGAGLVEYQELIERRRSVRSYSTRSVDPGALHRILRLVSRAPSAGNLQAYRIVVVRSGTKRRALAVAAGGQDFLAQAPLDLVFFADTDRSATVYGNRGASLYAVQDATIAAIYAVLGATNEGLSTAWVGAFDEETVQAVCGETKLRPIAIIPVGHGAETPGESSRRDLQEMVREI